MPRSSAWLICGIRIDLLGHVATGDEDHGRRLRAALQHVEIALKLDALEGNLDAFDGVRGELDHLFVVGEAASVQVTLLVIGLEDRMLGGGELGGGAVVELEGRHPVAGGFFFRRHALHALGDAADMLRDLGMALDARRKIPAVAVPVEDAAGFLDQIIENPLLAIAVQTGCTHCFNSSMMVVVGEKGCGVSSLDVAEMPCPSSELWSAGDSRFASPHGNYRIWRGGRKRGWIGSIWQVSAGCWLARTISKTVYGQDERDEQDKSAITPSCTSC